MTPTISASSGREAAGASMENTVTYRHDRFLENDLHFPNELARHKILDAMEISPCSGRPLRARVIAFRAGHGLHVDLRGGCRGAVWAHGAGG